MDPRVAAYESGHNCKLLGLLGPGPGQDGFVMQSHRMTAVKFFDRLSRYDRELEVYQILKRRGINNVGDHRVPMLVDFDAALRAIEMTIVERPFVLDFAGAKRPREVPDFEQHVIDEHAAHLQELFGDRYVDVMVVVELFKRATGFVLLDIHPGNIAFED